MTSLIYTAMANPDMITFSYTIGMFITVAGTWTTTEILKRNISKVSAFLLV